MLYNKDKSLKSFLLFVFFFSFAFSLDNNLKSIKLSVKNEDGAYLEGASVKLVSELESNELMYGGSTDESGFLILSDLEHETYNLSVSYIGYVTYEKEVKFLDNIQLFEYVVTLKIQPITISELEIISDADKRDFVGTASSIDTDALETINPLGTQEILENIPGISGFSDDGIGNSRINVGIRGLNPRRSSRVLILEDGIPIQPAIYVYPNMYYNPPVERIDEVEVVKGSGAVLYGPQTMGGVINYITKKPTKDSRPSLSIQGGENGYMSFFVETGSLSKYKFNPELQFLYKRGDGFRDNNSFYQYNGTFKLSYDKSKSENIYLKANVNYENSNATYTGLTLYSFLNNPNGNYKEYDNFKLFRASTDLIHTKKIGSKVLSINSLFVSYFNRDWWREDDIFLDADEFSEGGMTVYGSSQAVDRNLIRHGNGETSSGRLRKFLVVGSEKKYIIDNILFPLANELEFGGRLYFERFIDDGKKGYSPDARDGEYFLEAESFTDLNDDDIWNEGEDFTDSNGDGVWNDIEVVGQAHVYESQAFSGFLSYKIELNSDENRKFIINPGFRIEYFEQERIDRLNGSQYLDKTTFVALPGFGFNKRFNSLNIFGGIHRGFTPPSSGSLKVLNFGENAGADALELDAEKSWNKEIGLRYADKLVDLETAYYHVSIENMVAAGRMVDFKNLGSVNNSGFELFTTLDLNKFNFPIEIHGTYTYLNSKIQDGVILTSYPVNQVNCVSLDGGCQVDISGNTLPYAPEHTWSVGASIKMNDIFTISDIFQFRVDVKGVSDFFTDFENITLSEDGFNIAKSLGIAGEVPGYSLVNLSSKYSFGSGLSVSLSAKNLLDEIYIGSRLHSHPGRRLASESTGIIPGPRRQINFGVQYTF
ncbi:MAG: hypothetical protein CMG25_00580 [Candidatus Marinimicrobia bacterium]|nr:hypothetical protein [Candidatus Neomarinimicrobiota bacterium]|tara:strand:- start:25248 stop:27887 length:2640 start_codon:yes stop_codon:yes gene_type:complete